VDAIAIKRRIDAEVRLTFRIKAAAVSGPFSFAVGKPPYGLIAAGISVAIIAVVNTLGTQLNSTFNSVSTQLK
jgi:Flp/Fap pilin component